MRCMIITAALLAVSYAAPLDKQVNPVSTSSLAPTLVPSSTLAPASELSSTEASSHETLSSPAPTQEPSTVVPEHPDLVPQEHHTLPNHPLPDHPINLTQNLEPNRVETSPTDPEHHNPSPTPPPHQEHGINLHPNKPEKPDSELNDEDIAFLETIGSLAMSYELALLEELQKDYELVHHGNKHDHGHNHHDYGHNYEHYNSPNEDDKECDCDTAIFILPEDGHPTKVTKH